MIWQTKFRPGYLGGKREQIFAQWNTEYGKDKWRLSWYFEEKTLDFTQACEVYEEAYFIFFQNNTQVLTELINAAYDVYDDNVSNVSSGMDYKVQETKHTHIQDIAIRRCLKRLAVSFSGKKLLQIRHNLGEHPLSMSLSPGIVPFHRPDAILTPWLEGWWNPSSVECFYQSNRVLQILK